jgi:hypothetical protein
MFASKALLRSAIHRKMKIDGEVTINPGSTSASLAGGKVTLFEDSKSEVKDLKAGHTYRVEFSQSIQITDQGRVAVVVLGTNFQDYGMVNGPMIMSYGSLPRKPSFYFTPRQDYTVDEVTATLYVSE